MQDNFTYAPVSNINGHKPTTGSGTWVSGSSSGNCISTSGSQAVIITGSGVPGATGFDYANYLFIPSPNTVYSMSATFRFRGPIGTGHDCWGSVGFNSPSGAASPWMFIRPQATTADAPQTGDMLGNNYVGGGNVPALYYLSGTTNLPMTATVTWNTKTGEFNYFINNVFQCSGSASVPSGSLNAMFEGYQSGNAVNVSNVTLTATPINPNTVGLISMQDTFTYATANINGHAPTSTTGTAPSAWSVWANNGGTVSTDGTSNQAIVVTGTASGSQDVVSYRFQPAINTTYTLTATLNFNPPPGVGWAGFGFSTASGSNNGPWMLFPPQTTGSSNPTVQGDWGSGPIKQAGTGPLAAANYTKPIVATITWNTSSGQVRYYINNQIQQTGSIPWTATVMPAGGAYNVFFQGFGTVKSVNFGPITLTAQGAQGSPQVVIQNSNWVGTDDLGLDLPLPSETGGSLANRWVGLFYFTCHQSDGTYGPNYNVTDFLAANPGFWPWLASPPVGPKNPAWYWAQPLFGYYRSDDPWIVRKHLSMVSDIGVDFLFFDFTNNNIYDTEFTTLVTTAEDLKSKGLQVPRFVPFLHTNAEPNVEALYTKWYKPGTHDDLWFNWYGKPLMMCAMPTDANKLKNPALLSEIQNYFTWRPTGWNETPTSWLYSDCNPAHSANGPDGKIEQALACKAWGAPIWDNMSVGGVSCYPGFVPTYNTQLQSAQNPNGLFFQCMFDQADLLNAPILLVTGWNEWIASVWESPGVVFEGKTTKAGEGYFVDEFNMDFNRDVEPMKGGYGDNYYWQTVANIRQYKGVAAPELPSPAQTIVMDGNFTPWKNVRPIYKDTIGDVINRNWDGAPPSTHYTDTSARNDIAYAQVARDATNLYFHVQTAAPLTSSTGTNWMMLLINIDANSTTGWHGYDFLVNRTRSGSTCSVEHNNGGTWSWTSVGNVTAVWSGSDLEIAIPRSLLGVNPPAKLTIDFKWVDNIPATPTIMDFYSSGDVAPNGRFNYRFQEP